MAAPSRWASQAALDAMLRFNPQRQALAEQIGQANAAYNATVRAGRVAAKETEGSVQRALPQLQAAYAGAKAATAPSTTLVSQALAALPPDAQQYRANQAAAGGTFLANLAAAGASAQKAMLERSTRGREGAQYNQLSAHNQLVSQLGQIFARQQALSSEAGAFAQSEAEKLEAEAEDRAQRERASERTAATATAGQRSTAASAAAGRATTERGQDITSGTAQAGREQKSREHAEDLAQKKWEHEHPSKGAAGTAETAPGVKQLTVDQHNKARDEIEAIRNLAYGQRIHMHKNYNQTREGLETKIKGRSAYPNSGRLKAGLDLAYFGGVGTGTMKALHGEGLGLQQLGYPIYRPPNAVQTLQGLGGAFGRV